MKKLFLILLILLNVTQLTVVNAAGVVSGAKCSKGGSVYNLNGSKLICTKVGNSLIWRKPTVTKQTNPVIPKETPKPVITKETQAPSAENRNLSITEILWAKSQDGRFPIESLKYQVPTVLPTNWENVYANRDGIPFQAWSQVGKNISASSSKVGKIEILLGPNTIANFSDFKLRMDLVSRAVPQARNVSNVRIFAFNFQDSQWADSLFKELYRNESSLFKRWHSDPVFEICPINRMVCFQQAFLDSNLDGLMFIGMTDVGSKEQINQTYSEYSRAFRGISIGHEYFHLIQRVVFGDRWFQEAYNPPSWFTEGMAVFIENASANFKSFDDFMRFRAVDSKLLHPDCPYEYCVKVDREKIEDFLSIYNYSTNWNTFPYAMKYEMSARLVEVLVALKGPESLVNLNEYMATGKTFEQGFEKIYGISYETAKPLLAKIVYEQIAAGK